MQLLTGMLMKTVSNSDADRNLFNGTMKNCKKKNIYTLTIVILSSRLL